MNFTKFLMLAFMSTLFFTACSNDNDFVAETPDSETPGTENPDPEEPRGDYDNGILVLNEGGTGSVTYISEDLASVDQEIFQTVNSGDDLGAYVQSIFFDEEKAYIISNGSNLITVVNRYTFELLGKVDAGLSVPRYGIAMNGKLYVTNQADFATTADDYVAIINQETLLVENSVIIGDAVEFIEEENGKLYIQNATYGAGNKISVLNPTSSIVEATFTTNDALNSIEIENGSLFALSGNKLQKFNLTTQALESEIDLDYTQDGSSISAGNLEIEDENIYFTASNKVYTMALNATTAPVNALITYQTSSEYGVMYGFEVEDDRIFIGDGGDFASNSFVEIYDLNGTLLKNVEVGHAPNGFYFND
jgi:hypothetical protein